MLRKLILAVGLLCAAWLPANAQSSNANVVASCGSITYDQLVSRPLTQDPTGKLCTAASVSASITGFPTIQSTGTPIAVTTGGVTGTLPTGAVVVASNVGATNGAYCKLGASATTSDQLIPPNSWFAFTVGANTQLTCITSTSTTAVNMVGGSGLPTGSGGGGGGSGGGAITAASGSYASGALSSGSMVDLGSQADAACGTDNGACSAIALIKRGNQNATTVNTSINAAVPPCAAAPCLTTIGNVGIDPSSGASAPAEAFLALPATTTTQIIALSGTTKTYVTSRLLFSGGTVNVTFKYGTGSNCGTGTTTLDGPWPVIAQAGFSEAGSPVMVVPAGQALCVTTDASVSGGVKLVYQQK